MGCSRLRYREWIQLANERNLSFNRRRSAMAVINLNTLVLDSVCVVRGVVTGTMGMGLDSASGKTAAIPFSMRPPSHPYPQAGEKTSPRQDHADRCGAVG